MPEYHFNATSGFLGAVAIALAILMILLHVACCIGLQVDAKRYVTKHGDTHVLGGFMWAVTGLLLGPFAVALYWGMHRSTLNPKLCEPSAS